MTNHNPPFRLRFKNQWEEVHWFCNLGAFWPHDLTRRLIERTTPDSAQAREFATAEEANETLIKAGSPHGWQVLDAAGLVVE